MGVEKNSNYGGTALGLMLLGALLVLAPVYLRVTGSGRLWFYALAVLALAISIGVALSALAQYRKNPLLDHLGSSLFLLVLAGGLHLLAGFLSAPWDLVGRSGVLVLVAMAAIVLTQSLTEPKRLVGRMNNDTQVSPTRTRTDLGPVVVPLITFLGALLGLFGAGLQLIAALKAH